MLTNDSAYVNSYPVDYFIDSFEVRYQLHDRYISGSENGKPLFLSWQL